MPGDLDMLTKKIILKLSLTTSSVLQVFPSLLRQHKQNAAKIFLSLQSFVSVLPLFLNTPQLRH